MISAQPTNVWTLKNCKFRAKSKNEPSRAIDFHTADTRTNELHPIGRVVRTDSNGFVYDTNDMQLPNGCFVLEEAIIEASRDNGFTYPISWEVRNPYPPSKVKAQDGETDLLNTSVGGLWGENLGRTDGRVHFEDIYGNIDPIQVPTLDGSHIANDTIGVDHLKMGSVTHDKLADDAVQENNIKDKSVTHDKLADDAVDSNNIKNGAVTLESLAGSIGSLLRFKAPTTLFSTDQYNPTKIEKTDFILLLNSNLFLRNTYISTEDMEPNSFVLLVPTYDNVKAQETGTSYEFSIDRIKYRSEFNDKGADGTGAQSRFGFIIFKTSFKSIYVCRYLANGIWDIEG